jgi:hypothetical protein
VSPRPARRHIETVYCLQFPMPPGLDKNSDKLMYVHTSSPIGQCQNTNGRNDLDSRKRPGEIPGQGFMSSTRWCDGLRSILQLADDDSTSTLSLEKKREKMKTLAAAGLFILRVCWSGRVAGKFCGAVGMPSSRGSLDRACVGVGRGSPRPTSGSARYRWY